MRNLQNYSAESLFPNDDDDDDDTVSCNGDECDYNVSQQTATKAVVELAGNQTIQDGGFQLLILLAELHVPRMWVEQHPDDADSRVCSLQSFCFLSVL